MNSTKTSKRTHSFHIPVMGIGFTVDTPLKISHYGIDSVISIVDDILLEKLRKVYCNKFEMPYQEITEKVEDFRAKRITSYLNLVNELAEKKIDEMKSATMERSHEIKEYFNMLPDSSAIKEEFRNLASKFNFNEIKSWLKDNISMGHINVNIMTKIDKPNYSNNEKLPIEFNDAHAALRGFANSDLSSSVVLSAGMSPRLYTYIEQFDDFYPDADGHTKKKIVLKVSDYRSALIQGKFLAKKGLWVSEYRIESGLNCGGHAFATEGYLMGPILDEFRKNRKDLVDQVKSLYLAALERKNKVLPTSDMAIAISAQGGVGTNEEHQFLIDHYEVDSVGWGSPFLLVPEATTVDEHTRNQLCEAGEDDLYLSNISPLGVRFNSLKGNTKDVEKLSLAQEGIPGSSCPKKYLVSNTEFTEKPICTASRRYQRLKIKSLDASVLSEADYNREYNKVIEKSCICVGLGTSALLENNVDTQREGPGVSVCPGPNMAYFSRKMSLKEISDHIYGRANMISRNDRPNMFVKELNIYIEHLKERFEETKMSMCQKQEQYLTNFGSNLKEGISYYQELFGGLKDKFEDTKINVLGELENSKNALQVLIKEIEKRKLQPVFAE